VQAARARWPEERSERIALIGLLVLLVLGALVRLGLDVRDPSGDHRLLGRELPNMNLANSDLWADPTREVGYPLFLRHLSPSNSGHTRGK